MQRSLLFRHANPAAPPHPDINPQRHLKNVLQVAFAMVSHPVPLISLLHIPVQFLCFLFLTFLFSSVFFSLKYHLFYLVSLPPLLLYLSLWIMISFYFLPLLFSSLIPSSFTLLMPLVFSAIRHLPLLSFYPLFPFCSHSCPLPFLYLLYCSNHHHLSSRHFSSFPLLLSWMNECVLDLRVVYWVLLCSPRWWSVFGMKRRPLTPSRLLMKADRNQWAAHLLWEVSDTRQRYFGVKIWRLFLSGHSRGLFLPTYLWVPVKD